jgi:hypothetical protein
MTLGHGDVEMKTVTLEVARLKDVKRRARDAFKGRKQGARTSFATLELGKRRSPLCGLGNESPIFEGVAKSR